MVVESTAYYSTVHRCDERLKCTTPSQAALSPSRQHAWIKRAYELSPTCYRRIPHVRNVAEWPRSGVGLASRAPQVRRQGVASEARQGVPAKQGKH